MCVSKEVVKVGGTQCYTDLLEVWYLYEPNSPFDFSTVIASTPLCFY